MGEAIELTVVKGAINRSGIARIQSSVYDQLGLDDENQKITIKFNDKSIIRKVFADEFVDKQAIFLREDAREDLEVDEGDKVTIQAYKTVGEEIQEDYSETKETILEKAGEQKEKMKEKFQKNEDKE